MINAAQEVDLRKREIAIKCLNPLASFLRQCSERGLQYRVSPFFGLNEMRRAEAGPGVPALNEFSRIFGLHWTDADNSTCGDPTSLGLVGRRFLDLPLDVQQFIAISYASMTLMLTVARDVQSEPIAKFRKFIRLYRRLVDVVSIREITIARFVFAPPPSLDSRLRTIWEPILLNFTGREKAHRKGPSRFDHIDRISVNGSFDLGILNAAIFADHHGLDGKRQDSWLITADSKLTALNEAVHHTDLGTGLVGLAVATEDYSDEGNYWLKTNEDMRALSNSVRWNLKPSVERQRKRAIALLAMAEQGIFGQHPPSGIPLKYGSVDSPDGLPNLEPI